MLEFAKTFRRYLGLQKWSRDVKLRNFPPAVQHPCCYGVRWRSRYRHLAIVFKADECWEGEALLVVLEIELLQ